MRSLCAVLKPFLKSTLGFSLIEMAIVLAIMGIVAGLSIPALNHFQQLERDKTTRQHQEMIFSALGAFVNREYRLPFAANRQGDGSEKLNTNVGAVPYRSLGLSSSVAMDGWGHPMTYAVNRALAMKSADDMRSVCDADDSSTLKINDEHGSAFKNDIPAVVLISEGPAHKQAKGAYEIANLQGPTFYKYALKDISETPFRHRVSFISRSNLMGIYAHNPCKRSKAIDTHPNRGTRHPDIIESDEANPDANQAPPNKWDW